MADDRTLADLLEGERIAMVVTPDGRARPMTVLRREDARLWFVTDRTADWVARLIDGERVTVTISDLGDSLFVSLTGTAATTTDRGVLETLWSPPLRAWFQGPDDPNVVALSVDVAEGEYWDGPDTTVGRIVRGLAGMATGKGSRTMGRRVT